MMLSETPSNDAVDFLTGAGGFLHPVIFGYTGPRVGPRGLEPTFPPMLPTSITRLVHHNVNTPGRRVEVVVESTGRHMRPRARAVVR